MSLSDRIKPTLDRAKEAAKKLPIKETAAGARKATERAETTLSGWPKGRLIGTGIALAIVLFLAFNIFTSSAFRNARADLTANSLYSLSNGTRTLLSELAEPLHFRLFLSRELVQTAPQLSAYANRVQAMLSTYRDLSNGKITLEVIDPKPFSDDEDRAVGFGINKIRAASLNQELFFGLAATNSTRGSAKIPVFSPDREAFLEYDLTRMVAELGQPKKPVIALIDGIALGGNPMARQPEAQVMTQLKELYTVENLRGDVDALPDGTRVVMVVHPRNVSDRTLYTIDQWVLSGGATLVFVDPFAETAPGLRPGMPAPNPQSDFDKLLTSWGVKFDTKVAVGDPKTAIRAVREVDGRDVPATNLPWLALTKENLATGDALVAQLSNVIVTTAGHFETTSDAVTLKPLLTASPGSGILAASEAGNQTGDPRLLFDRLKVSETPLVLAARLEGTFGTAFPKGKPEKSEAKSKPLTKLEGKPNVILVGDADMTMDRNWIRRRQLLGQVIAEPFANNGAFVLNAVEQMIGGVALADLRGRGVSARPFETIEALAKEAEAKYLKRQQGLQQKLQATERRLAEVAQRTGSDGAVLDDESIKAVEQFRSDLLSTRAELRNVQFDLRREVDGLKSWITLVNVGLVPALVAALALGYAIRRTRRPLPKREPASATRQPTT
ncbi:MAG: GldG family protein [Pseudomonadota bacterium]